jgi:hypothetical protein
MCDCHEDHGAFCDLEFGVFSIIRYWIPTGSARCALEITGWFMAKTIEYGPGNKGQDWLCREQARNERTRIEW